jgi:galacturan 1,4-alpha-galacturonidase
MSFFQIGGADVNIYGGGTLDGNGDDRESISKRPILFVVVSIKGA